MTYTSILHFFSVFSEHINHYIALGGYPFLFLAVIFEGLPLIGTLIPGHLAIIAGGFLAHTGILNIWWVLAVCISAAILGDAGGFFLGRRYGIQLIDRLKRYFFIRDEHIAKAQKLLTRHTGKAMILGRLSPVTRALMPFLVGTGKTSLSKFWLFNIIGALIWVGSSVMLGYLFSFGYEAISGYFGKAVVGAVLFSVIMFWGYRFINIRFHIFRRYELFALVINACSLIILSLMVRDAWGSTSFMTNFDIWVNGIMNSYVTSSTIAAAEGIGFVTGPAVIISTSLILCGVFIYRRRIRSTAVVILSTLSAFGAFTFMKAFFGRARPDNALQIFSDPSFPSGHATMAAAFLFVCAYLFSRKISYWVWRELFIVSCAVLTIIIGFSRIILNVHWVSDVIAGWALGIFCATASIILVRYASELVKGRRV